MPLSTTSEFLHLNGMKAESPSAKCINNCRICFLNSLPNPILLPFIERDETVILIDILQRCLCRIQNQTHLEQSYLVAESKEVL